MGCYLKRIMNMSLPANESQFRFVMVISTETQPGSTAVPGDKARHG